MTRQRRWTGEGEALGWVVIGHLLLDGRTRISSNVDFARWVLASRLDHGSVDERTAAMWAAQDAERLAAAAYLFPRVRTLRGLHRKWRTLRKLGIATSGKGAARRREGP
ncbi:MAG: hypothetical protein ACOCYW_05375 [Roseicyclus sp.]